MFFVGIDKDGKLRKGKIHAKDKRTAYSSLMAQGIRPISIKGESSLLQREILQRKPSDEALSFVLVQLSLLLSSGLSLTKALHTLHEQMEERRLSQALLSVKESIEKGEPIHQAFENADIFPEFLIEMLKTAERGENLEKVFSIAGEFLQRMSEIKSRIISNMAYPSFVIVLSLLSVLFVVKFVVPKIASVLASLGKDLPLITKALLILSKALGYFLYALPLFVVLFLLKGKLLTRDKMDEMYLKVPIFGRVSYYFNLSRFAGTLSMSFLSGIPLIKSIALSRGSITNAYLRSKLMGVEEDVAKGGKLSSALKKTGIFPQLFLNLLQTGEESGELEKMLSLLHQVYEKQAMRVISFWVRFAEPLAILFIGLIVAFVVFSVVLPITEISSGIRK